MHLYKDRLLVDYEELDKQISTVFLASFNPDTFCVLPNKSAYKYLNNMDWFEILNQAVMEGDAKTLDDVILYYTNDYASIMKREKKTLQELIPQLYTLIKYLKKENITMDR